MKSHIVRCEDGGKEGAWIALLITLIILVGWILLPFNQAVHATSELAKHQVSIQALAPKQLTMVADLRLAHEEIRNIYIDTEQWASVETLEQSWLAPFVKDKSWQHQGQHRWKQIANGIYQGVPEPVVATGNEVQFLLISRQQEIELWLDTENRTPLFTQETTLQTVPQETDFITNELINAGWQQVVFQHPETHPQ